MNLKLGLILLFLDKIRRKFPSFMTAEEPENFPLLVVKNCLTFLYFHYFGFLYSGKSPGARLYFGLLTRNQSRSVTHFGQTTRN